MEVWFYHLQNQTLEQALPKLLERSAARGWRAVVQCPDEARLKALDDRLWSYEPESFLAHAVDGDPRGERQPVLLTSGEGNPNGAAVRILIGGADLPAGQVLEEAGYERLIVLFDGNSAGELATAREQWGRAKARGLAPTYWKQERGAWVKGP